MGDVGGGGIRHQHGVVYAQDRTDDEGVDRGKDFAVYRCGGGVEGWAVFLCLSAGASRGCGNSADSVGSYAELDGVAELYRDTVRDRGRGCVWSAVHSRQCEDQPATILSCHDRHSLLCGVSADCEWAA